ncbi:MAG TPA: MlaD family protein, partial [Rhodospirillales bacterium]|nr:MlaD family protein [Rhodospirillales bacterium]
MGDKITGDELRSFAMGALAFIAFAAVLALSYFGTRMQGATADSRLIYAAFNRVDGLAVGDEVQLSGVPIGRVTAMTLQPNFRARLALLVDKDIPLPTDTSAAIHTDGLFGRKFVVLEPGGDEALLGDGGVITFTQDSLIVGELLDLIIAEGRA